MSDTEIARYQALNEMSEGGGGLGPRPLSSSSLRAVAAQLASLAAAIEAAGDVQAAPAAAAAAGEIASSLAAADPVEYWISIPEELWRADALNIGPPDGKLWLTAKQTEGAVGRGPTTVRRLIRDYPIGIMYGGQWSVNRYRAIAAVRRRLAPRKKAEN